MKPLTKVELYKINKRVDEIAALLEQELDEDINDNLCAELEIFIHTLESSIKITLLKESGLRLVK